MGGNLPVVVDCLLAVPADEGHEVGGKVVGILIRGRNVGSGGVQGRIR